MLRTDRHTVIASKSLRKSCARTYRSQGDSVPVYATAKHARTEELGWRHARRSATGPPPGVGQCIPQSVFTSLRACLIPSRQTTYEAVCRWFTGQEEILR